MQSVIVNALLVGSGGFIGATIRLCLLVLGGTAQARDAIEIHGSRFSVHSIEVESSQSVAVAAADFDGDGHLDLVISGDPELTILRGDGTGGFAGRGHVAGGNQPVDFALADFDEDGDVDIVVANHETDYLTILLGDGHGSFKPAPHSPMRIAVSPHPHAVRAADFDGDGHFDLAVDHRRAGGLLVLRGLGTGRFKMPGTFVDGGGDPYRGMAIGEIDGDTRPDIVTPNPGNAAVMLNDSSKGEISFSAVEEVPARAPFGVGLGDFNGDGKLDLIAAAGQNSPLVELFLGADDGRFAEAPGSPYSFAPGGKSIAVGDFNGDGIDDAVVACWNSPEVLVLLGGREAMRTTTLPGGKNPWGLAVADLNGDGKDDLVVADDGAPQVLVYVSRP